MTHSPSIRTPHADHAVVLRRTPRITRFVRNDLVSDQAGVAPIRDPQLVNAWGIALSPTRGAFWVAGNETGVATLYLGDTPDGTPLSKAGLVVTIPGGVPTGLAFNGTTGFTLAAGGGQPAIFLFASESGQITAWNLNLAPMTQAVTVITTPGASYKGLAIAESSSGPRLYAANFAAGTIDVFDANLQRVTLESSAFRDRRIPSDFAPFNVQEIGGKLFVTYTKRGENGDDVAGRGNGFIDVFDTDGHRLRRLVRRGPLDSPWGLAQAPEGFGRFKNALLVGNFGNGRINAFSMRNGRFLGTLTEAPRRPIVVDGLWGMAFGNGVTAGRADVLYFAGGPNGEANGLFGSIRPA
jgi:uncharacterized protein (TIGR03118 family)